MTAALFAKIVLQSMKQSECFGWNKKLLVELEDYYESKASEVLIKLFEEDPAIASQSLRSKQESWYGYTPLELAERGKFFISNFYLVKKKRYKYGMFLYTITIEAQMCNGHIKWKFAKRLKRGR